jgi:hypothetical protein
LAWAGWGTWAVKIAAALGAPVTVISTSERKKEDALRLGAGDFLVSRDEGVLEAAAGRFDLILNTVSAPHELNAHLNLLATDGTMVMLGLATEPMPVSTLPLLFGRRRLAGSLIGASPRRRRCWTSAPTRHRGRHRDDPRRGHQRRLRADGQERRALPLRDRSGDPFMNVLVNLPAGFFAAPELADLFERLSGLGSLVTTSHDTADALRPDLAAADAVILWSWPPLTDDLLDAAPRLIYRGHLDITQAAARTALARGVPVSVSRHGFSPAVAEMALALTLGLLRKRRTTTRRCAPARSPGCAASRLTSIPGNGS